jgi:hypothetical protein
VKRSTARRRRAADPPTAPVGEWNVMDALLRGLGLLLIVAFACVLLSLRMLVS